MAAKDFRELRVYQLAFETALRIFEISDHYDHICSQLSLMMAEPGKWCPADSKRQK